MMIVVKIQIIDCDIKDEDNRLYENTNLWKRLLLRRKGLTESRLTLQTNCKYLLWIVMVRKTQGVPKNMNIDGEEKRKRKNKLRQKTFSAIFLLHLCSLPLQLTCLPKKVSSWWWWWWWWGGGGGKGWFGILCYLEKTSSIPCNRRTSSSAISALK